MKKITDREKWFLFFIYTLKSIKISIISFLRQSIYEGILVHILTLSQTAEDGNPVIKKKAVAKND